MEPLEEIIDMLKDTLKARHIERLADGTCSVETGVSFLEIITNLERIADHCSNIAIGVMQRQDSTVSSVDPHTFAIHLREKFSSEYERYYDFFIAKYYDRLNMQND